MCPARDRLPSASGSGWGRGSKRQGIPPWGRQASSRRAELRCINRESFGGRMGEGLDRGRCGGGGQGWGWPGGEGRTERRSGRGRMGGVRRGRGITKTPLRELRPRRRRTGRVPNAFRSLGAMIRLHSWCCILMDLNSAKPGRYPLFFNTKPLLHARKISASGSEPLSHLKSTQN